MASDASKSVSMITHLHRTLTGTVRTSEALHDATANGCHIIEQANQSGRRLRNLLLFGNAVAWIVIIFVARALFF
jgi:hypothetical protein